MNRFMGYGLQSCKGMGKGKEEYLYSAFIQHLVSKQSDMDHTDLLANYTMLPS